MTIEVARGCGPEEMPSYGLVRLHLGSSANRYRLAHVRDDLAFAPWVSIRPGASTVATPWAFAGSERGGNRVWAEIDYPARIPQVDCYFRLRLMPQIAYISAH